MAQYDQATKDFMQELTKGSKVEPRSRGQKLRRMREKHHSDPMGIKPKVKSIASEIGMPEGTDPTKKIRVYGATAANLLSKKKVPATIGRQLTREFMEKEAATRFEEFGGRLPLGLYNNLVIRLGPEWSDWEPETLAEAIHRDGNLFGTTEVDIEKAKALQIIVKTNFPAEMWHVFENVGHALNSNPVMINQVTPLDIHECAMTLAVIMSLRNDPESPEKFKVTDEVCAYIAACAMNSGLAILPPKYFDERCQEALDALNLDPSIKERVLAALEGNEQDHDEDVADQIAKMKEIMDYVGQYLGGS